MVEQERMKGLRFLGRRQELFGGLVLIWLGVVAFLTQYVYDLGTGFGSLVFFGGLFLAGLGVLLILFNGRLRPN